MFMIGKYFLFMMMVLIVCIYRHIFHYIVDDGITYLCLADEEFGRRIAFAFLEDVRNRFKATYGDRGKTALAYGMNADFSRVLQNQMVC
jgi:vesicle-associated membrane protein 7